MNHWSGLLDTAAGVLSVRDFNLLEQLDTWLSLPQGPGAILVGDKTLFFPYLQVEV
jgi:hypothetical protein